MNRCFACGHRDSWHFTTDRQCIHEVYDDDLDVWMRCGCDGFVREAAG